MHFTLRSVLVAALSVAGAARAAEMVQISPDTYMVTQNSHAGLFVSFPKLKASVIRQANAFAERQGKIAIPISLQESGIRLGQFPYVEYQFRVVDKDDPEARRTALVPRADVVVEKTDKITADVQTHDDTERKPDFYAELMKLDDLRKRGLLTDEEFELQKKKLLETK